MTKNLLCDLELPTFDDVYIFCWLSLMVEVLQSFEIHWFELSAELDQRCSREIFKSWYVSQKSQVFMLYPILMEDLH